MSNLTLRTTTTATDPGSTTAKNSAISHSEMDSNLILLNDEKLENISEDTSPQLGGDLDVNGNSIVSTSDANINITPNGTGRVVLDGLSYPDADGTANQVIQTDGAGALSFTTITSGISNIVEDTTPELGGNLDAQSNNITNLGTLNTHTIPGGTGTFALTSQLGIQNVSEDTTPQLGGDLDVNSNSIVSTSNANISITPDGTGLVNLNGLLMPGTDGTNGQVIQTDGAGNLSFVTITSGISDVVDDTTPQLGGNLDCQGNEIQNAVLEDYAETVYAIGSNDSPSISVSNGNVQTVSITSGLALPAFSDAATGQSVTLIVTGSGTLSGTGSHKFAEGNKTLTTESVVSIFYDGTTYYTSVATNFTA